MPQEWDHDGSRAVTAARRPEHFIEQQLAPLLFRPTRSSGVKTEYFTDEKEFWSCSERITFASVRLDSFRLSDWFPRTPGMYWSQHGTIARNSIWSGPTDSDPELGQIFSPEGKMELVEDGGIGTIRLRPRRIEGTDCWLATALKGRQCAGGIPLALPHSFLAEGKVAWGDTVTVCGQVRFLQDAGLNDVASYVHHASPLIIFVEDINSLPSSRRSTTPTILTPVALFERESNKSDILKHLRRGRRSEFGYTFVHSAKNSGRGPNDSANWSSGGLDDAAHWIERYAAKHGGRIVTNFDERSPILADAPLSYQRLIARTYDRLVIESLNLEKLADRIDSAVTNEYNNYGNLGAMGDHARSDRNTF